jgi:uncharacterized repeat protein (TIGR01451 family)
MRKLQELTTTLKLILITSLIGVVLSVVGSHIVYAFSESGVPSNVSSNARAYDDNCQNSTDKYVYEPWVASSSDSTDDSAITVPYGTTTVPLQYDQFVMVCHDHVDPSTIRYPADGKPVNTTLTNSYNNIVSITTSHGSISGSPAGQTLTTDASTSTRYWYEPKATFGNVSAAITSQITITITVNSIQYNRFSDGSYVCVVGGTATTNPLSCKPTAAKYTIIITPTNPPTVTIMGTVYTYDTTTKALGVKSGVTVDLHDGDTGSDARTATDGDGNYSLTVDKGDLFAVNVTSAGTYKITPRGGNNYASDCDSDPANPPYCSAYGGYNFQTAGSTSDTATQGVHNRGVNGGYDFTSPETSTPPRGPAYTLDKEVAPAGSSAYSKAISVKSGAEVTYKVSLSSYGTAAVTNANVSDKLPAGITYIANSLKLNGAAHAVGNFFSSGITIASVANGATDTFTFNATAGVAYTSSSCRAQSLNNVAATTATGLAAQNATATVALTCPGGRIVVTAPTPTCQDPYVSGTVPQPGKPFTVTAEASWSPWSAGDPDPTTFPFTVTGSGGLTITGPTSNTNTQPSSTVLDQADTYTAIAAAAGAYTITEGGCSTTVVIDNEPYLKVYGGDTVSGSGFKIYGDCAPSPGSSGGTYAWNTNSYSGSSTNVGAFALAFIDGLASANGETAPGDSVAAPKSLTFANTFPAGITDANGYGGDFGATSCIPDYYNELLTNAASNVTVTNETAPSTIGSTTINSRTAYLSTADVTITGNISFDTTANYPTPDSLPLFYVVVKGADIYIDNNVTEADGVYIAEPDANGNGGKIFTCAIPGGSLPTVPADPFSQCTQELTVRGSLTAKDVYFLRAKGTVGNATTEPNCTITDANVAEQICYLPDQWLTSPFSVSQGINSISKLPPVL